jgi:hypothetical protein
MFNTLLELHQFFFNFQFFVKKLMKIYSVGLLFKCVENFNGVEKLFYQLGKPLDGAEVFDLTAFVLPL